MPNHVELLQKLTANQLDNLELRRAYEVYNFIPSCLALLKTNTSLKSLDLRDTTLRREHFELLTEALAENPQLPLQKLNLSASRLGSEYIKRVRRTIYFVNTLEKLCEALKVNARLEELDLSDNALEVDDMENIGDMLKLNKSLKKLTIQNNSSNLSHKNVNGYYSMYAQPLAEALKENSSLEYLDLSKNNISLKDLHLFAEAMETNKTLKFLILESRSVIMKSDDWAKIQRHLEANRQLQSVNAPVPILETVASTFIPVFSVVDCNPNNQNEKRKRDSLKSTATTSLPPKRFKA